MMRSCLAANSSAEALALVQRLAQSQAVDLVGGVAGVAAVARIEAVPGNIALQADTGQQGGAALWQDFQRRRMRRDGCLVARVGLQRQLVYRYEVIGGGRLQSRGQQADAGQQGGAQVIA
jgi:hypothetical protein